MHTTGCELFKIGFINKAPWFGTKALALQSFYTKSNNSAECFVHLTSESLNGNISPVYAKY